jgi:hypothetical protein
VGGGGVWLGGGGPFVWVGGPGGGPPPGGGGAPRRQCVELLGHHEVLYRIVFDVCFDVTGGPTVAADPRCSRSRDGVL